MRSLAHGSKGVDYKYRYISANTNRLKW